MKNNRIRQSGRLKVVFSSFCIAFVILSTRVFYVQVFESEKLTNLADRQHNVQRTLSPKRGKIYDRKMVELAKSINMFSVYSESKHVENKEVAAQKLAPILNMSKSKLLKKLQKNKSFVWLKRQVDESVLQKIKELDIAHIYSIKEPKRFYPSAESASHILGFVDIDGKGLEGLELLFDKHLKGKQGVQFVQRDAKRRMIPSLQYDFTAPVEGHHIVLTIDNVIQNIVERELDIVCKKYRAKGGSIIVMEPVSGKILALANWPTYDLNTFYNSRQNQRRNRAITDSYEPGSTFKIITAAAALNEGIVEPSDRFFCEDGEYHYKNRILHDHRPHGWLTFHEIIKVSSNIGICKVAKKVGKKKLMHYIEEFGFGEKCGIDLPGEVSGIVRPLNQWSAIAITSIPMGQGIAVTPLQLMCAYATIANNGLLMKPMIIDRIVNKDWQIIKKYNSIEKKRVIKKETAVILKEFLASVVEDGTATQAQIKGISVAGKTGTAQKLEENKTYSHDKFVASFFGFAPAENPVIVVGVAIDEPQPVHYGGVVAGPVFKKIVEDALKYLGIHSELRKPEQTKKKKGIKGIFSR